MTAGEEYPPDEFDGFNKKWPTLVNRACEDTCSLDDDEKDVDLPDEFDYI